MNKNTIDLTDARFGRLTAVALNNMAKGKSYWLCLCDCGQPTIARSDQLKRGSTKSCGCLNRELTSARIYTDQTTHGFSRTKEYKVWQAAIRRCENPKDTFFENYGGRGITMCARWRHSFVDFIADMGWRPAKGYSLDRIDNDGPYEPGNVRWATAKEQANNRRPRRMAA